MVSNFLFSGLSVLKSFGSAACYVGRHVSDAQCTLRITAHMST
jgi:hypothetical protein